MFTGLTDTQLSGMGTALSQGGTGLLHIAIQLMPYAIAFTIIFIIFGLVKNWSKLKTNWEFNKFKYSKKGNTSQKSRNISFIDEMNSDILGNVSEWSGLSDISSHGYIVKGNKIYRNNGYESDDVNEVCDVDDPYFEENVYKRYKRYKG